MENSQGGDAELGPFLRNQSLMERRGLQKKGGKRLYQVGFRREEMREGCWPAAVTVSTPTRPTDSTEKREGESKKKKPVTEDRMT